MATRGEITEASQRLGITEESVRKRLARGWPLEKALTAQAFASFPSGKSACLARGMRLTAKARVELRRARARAAAIVLLCDVVDREVMSPRAQALVHNRLGELATEEAT